MKCTRSLVDFLSQKIIVLMHYSSKSRGYSVTKVTTQLKVFVQCAFANAASYVYHFHMTTMHLVHTPGQQVGKLSGVQKGREACHHVSEFEFHLQFPLQCYQILGKQRRAIVSLNCKQTQKKNVEITSKQNPESSTDEKRGRVVITSRGLGIFPVY